MSTRFTKLPYLDHGWLVWLVWLVCADCVPAVHRAALYTALMATLRAGSGRDLTSAAGPQQVTVYDLGLFLQSAVATLEQQSVLPTS